MTSEEYEAKANKLWERAEAEAEVGAEDKADRIAVSAYRHYRRAAELATGPRRRELFDRAIEMAELFLHGEQADRAIRDMVRDTNAVPNCPAPNQMALFS